MAEVDAAITPKPLDCAAAVAAVTAPDVGGVAVFVGTVRRTASVPGNRDRPVVALTYEAHPRLAAAELRTICEEAADKWELERVFARHREGRCGLGEPTVVVACGAPHRADALEACRWIIDEIKGRVPVWKREEYADGSSWVGLEGA